MIEIGLKHTSELTVTEDVIAITVGSGDLPVLATPMMMALMENAAMLAIFDELPEGCTTVGGHIESSHLKPSKIGDVVRAVAEVTKVDGKKIEFKVAPVFRVGTPKPICSTQVPPVRIAPPATRPCRDTLSLSAWNAAGCK